MNENHKILLTPFNIGKETIKNRLVMGPMGGSSMYDSRGGFSEASLDFYVERAKGGFGLLYTGAMMIDMTVDAYDPKTQQNPLYVPGHFMRTATTLNERCASYGTKVIAELTLGTGRNYPTMHAPSAVECYAYPMFKGVEMTIDEIHAKRDACIAAAALVKKSGFAGVDLHSLHWGYLLDEFTMAITNKREDEYGGSLENRMRLVKELVTGIKQTCGADFPVTVGLSCKSFIKALNKASLTGEEEAGRTLEEAIAIAKMLEEMGVDAIMTDVGMYDSFYYACPPCYMPKGHGLKYYAELKKHVNVPIIGRSRMGDIDMCADAISSGVMDAAMFSRPTLADPHLARKVEMGVPEKIRPCIGCNMGCIGRLLEKGTKPQCAVNPRAFNESTTKPKKSINPRNIAVVGGGVAGMQAALTAAECGHKVELYEKTNVLGGELNAAGAHGFKSEIKDLKNWFIRELEEKKVPIHLESKFTPDMITDKGVDTVILATGASPIMPASIGGIEKAISAVELLEGKKAVGESVIVVGGGMVGCETAVDLADEGKKVTLVEALPKILSAEFIPQQHKMMLKDMLEYTSVEVVEGYKLVSITDEGAVVEPADGGEQKVLAADNVVLSIGLKPNKSLAPDFYGKGVAVYEIGAAKKAGNIINSVHDAFEVVYNLD